MIILRNLPLPCSKNVLHMPIRCGKWTKMVRTKDARKRTELLVAHIWKQLGGRLHEPAITRPCSLQWTITFPDRRKRDGQNYLEHLADCLQAANVVGDDALIVHEVREVMPTFSKPGFVNLTIEELPEGIAP